MSQAAPPVTSHPLRQILIDLAVMSVIGFFLGLIGPFGTIAVPLVWRVLSWLAFAYVGYVLYRPMGFVVEWGARRLALPKGGLWVAAVIVATLPMTVAVQVITALPGSLRWPGIEVFAGTYLSVLVIGGAVTLLFNVLKPGQASVAAVPVHAPTPAPAPEPAPSLVEPTPAPANPLIDQLPAELGSAIIALEMEDHYVRVHTALGSALVLMRLRDAMAHVAEIEGMQVHRSWWVARAAVEDVMREGRNVRLTLARGIEAPVARAKLADLKDARWI